MRLYHASEYLVFDGSSDQPACVVEFGDMRRLAEVEKVLAELSPRLPGTVPASLRCAHWSSGIAVHVQQGMAGMPWFRVSDGMRTPAAWKALIDRACRGLASFHAAVRGVPAWSGLVYPGMELSRQAMLSRCRGVALSERVLRRVEEDADADSGGLIRSCWQHGDYSLNNLLVSRQSMAIIDFDEFGRTRVPMHDAFGLALSVPLSQGDDCPLSALDCITRCVEVAREVDEDAERLPLPALLMHHLLWRINQCDGLSRRDALRRVLLRWTDELATQPECFLGDLA